MLMRATHLRENIFTREEGKAKGIKINTEINYHGLGKDLFLDVIDSLDNPKIAYKGTKKADNSSRRKNYFLIITALKDKDNNTINVPIHINQDDIYYKVFIKSNKIATVFGRNDLAKYIAAEAKKGNLIKQSNPLKWPSPINGDLGKIVSVNKIIQVWKKAIPKMKKVKNF